MVEPLASRASPSPASTKITSAPLPSQIQNFLLLRDAATHNLPDREENPNSPRETKK
jgi:hypothetical protein